LQRFYSTIHNFGKSPTKRSFSILDDTKTSNEIENEENFDQDVSGEDELGAY